MSVVREMNKTNNSSMLQKMFIVSVVAASVLLGVGAGFKVAHAQQSAGQATQFKSILNDCSTVINAHTPDVNKLQSCDQKMSSISVQCDKNQMGHSICDDARLQDYMNKRGNSNP
jgi:hypothetical protein